MTFLFYLLAFVGGLGVTVLVTPLTARLAHRWNVYDHPDIRKIHSSPIPYLGGLAIIAGFCLAVAGGAMVAAPDVRPSELIVILGGALFLGAIGLADDLWGLPAVPRILAEIGIAVVVAMQGVSVSIFQSTPLNITITVFWIVGITNAFNLLDNMDGLSSGVGAVGATFLFLPAAINGQYLVASLAVALAGCSLGFLWHNFTPAKIFMGDAGALFLGFLLAILGLKIKFPENDVSATLWVPVLILGVAIFDTCLVVLSRVKRGVPVFKAGKDHVSHRLANLGLSIRSSVLVLYLVSACMGFIGFVVSLSSPLPAWLLIGMLSTLALIAGALLMRVEVVEHQSEEREVGRVSRVRKARPPRADSA